VIRFQGILGLAALVGIAWLLSEDRRRISLRTLAAGLGLQLLLAALLLGVPVFSGFFAALNKVVLALEQSTREGTAVVFGYLAGTSLPFDETTPGASYILAFRGLPLILVMSALSALLFYWRVLPLVVRVFSKLFQRTLGIGGAEAVGVAANIFVGMVEAPLLVRPYVSRLTRSELFSLMTVGMATIAGTMMVLYATIVGAVIPDALGHILTASIISAPAAVMLSRILVPGRSAPTPGDIDPGQGYESAMDAIVKGTFQGVDLLIKVIALIIVLVSLVSLVNIVFGLLWDVGGAPLTLQRILGWGMAPLMWLVGVPWSEAATAGSLMGTKTVLNEFIAYVDLAALPAGTLDERSRLLVMYAMCGFANPGSLGIMIGGLGAMAPERRGEIVALGIRSIVAGTMATCMTAAVAGLFI
jgi:CNT family concentrative nucleoside transporter